MLFSLPEVARWDADRQAVEFGAELGGRKLCEDSGSGAITILPRERGRGGSDEQDGIGHDLVGCTARRMRGVRCEATPVPAQTRVAGSTVRRISTSGGSTLRGRCIKGKRRESSSAARVVARGATAVGKATLGSARYGGSRYGRLQGRRQSRHNHVRRDEATPLNRPAMSSRPIAADGLLARGSEKCRPCLGNSAVRLTFPSSLKELRASDQVPDRNSGA